MKTFEAEWRARFERFGQAYTDEHAIAGWSVEGLTRRTRLFRRQVAQLPLPAPARVLEVGCGTGTYVRHLTALGHTVIGVDYALPVLGHARSRQPAGTFVAADGYHLPFTDRAFDFAVCIGVLQAVSRPDQLLGELARVLRPGGLLLVEALNALEAWSATRRVRDRLKGRPPRVRLDSPFALRRCLGREGVALLRRVNVYLPPRRFPALGRLLDPPAVIRLLETLPGLGLMLAHAFWMIGRKTSELER
jgi:SAM-dependent methyltransferase